MATAMLYRCFGRIAHAIYIATEAAYHGRRYDWDVGRWEENKMRGLSWKGRWESSAHSAIVAAAKPNARMRRSFISANCEELHKRNEKSGRVAKRSFRCLFKTRILRYIFILYFIAFRVYLHTVDDVE